MIFCLLKGLLFKITDYLDIFDIIKFRKINKEIYHDIFNKSDYLFRNLASYYNILVTENKTSLNFRKEKLWSFYSKSHIKNYFENVFTCQNYINT